MLLWGVEVEVRDNGLVGAEARICTHAGMGVGGAGLGFGMMCCKHCVPSRKAGGWLVDAWWSV